MVPYRNIYINIIITTYNQQKSYYHLCFALLLLFPYQFIITLIFTLSPQRLVLSALSKACALDLIHTQIIKSVASTICPFIQKIINLSLAQYMVASEFKMVIVKPLIYKPNLDLIYQNYRPVSKLPFVSELLEQSVIDELE